MNNKKSTNNESKKDKKVNKSKINFTRRPPHTPPKKEKENK